MSKIDFFVAMGKFLAKTKKSTNIVDASTEENNEEQVNLN